MHHNYANRDVSRARSKIDERLPFPLAVPSIDVRYADFQFQRRGHAIRGFRGIILRVLPMLVQIDKPGRNHQPLGINRLLPLERFARNDRDFPAANPEIPHFIQPRFRIHHSSVGDNQVIDSGAVGCTRSRGHPEGGTEQQHRHSPLPPSTND